MPIVLFVALCASDRRARSCGTLAHQMNSPDPADGTAVTPGEAPRLGVRPVRSRGIPSGSSSCPRACSSRCRVRTGHWRSAITSAAGTLPRLTGPLRTTCGPGYGSGRGRGDQPPALGHGTFRRTWPGRAQMMSWRPTGTCSASRASPPSAPGLRSPQLGAVHSVLGYWTTKLPRPGDGGHADGDRQDRDSAGPFRSPPAGQAARAGPVRRAAHAGCGEVRVPRRLAGARCREQRGAASRLFGVARRRAGRT